MAKSGKDERSWEDRVASMGGTIGDAHVDFDHSEEDAGASPAAILADEILLALKPCGMTAFLAFKAASFLMDKKLALQKSGQPETGAMDSLIRSDMQKYLMEILRRILEAPKPRLSVGCLMLALGMEQPGLMSQRQWAENQVVSLEHVSNEVVAWQTLLNLPATSAQKSESAKESYRLTNQPRKAA